MKMGSSKPQIFFYISLIHLVIPMAAQSFCGDTGNYTSNSTYRANLDGLLASMINNTKIDYGFYNFSAGESLDKVYAIALCSGDASPSECSSCINGSRYNLLQACPNQKEAINWAWDKKCLIRYSYKSIFNISATDPKRASFRVDDALDVEGFYNALLPLLDSLRYRAAKGNSTRKFALQSGPAPNRQTIFSLMQCTPDLSERDCNFCLLDVQAYTSSCCSEKQGGIFLAPSCVLRYETYRFYDPSAETPPPPPPSPPLTAASPPPELPTSTPEITSLKSAVGRINDLCLPRKILKFLLSCLVGLQFLCNVPVVIWDLLLFPLGSLRSQGNYNANSTNKTNLNVLLSSISQTLKLKMAFTLTSMAKTLTKFKTLFDSMRSEAAYGNPNRPGLHHYI